MATPTRSANEPRAVVPAAALGRRFRSTTEARWAVFLHALGVVFEYEPETYDLGDLGWYLPDFWLSAMGMHLEVKPSGHLGDSEYDKARALFLLTERPVLIAQGFGRPPFDEITRPDLYELPNWPGRLYDVWTTKSPLSPAGAGGNGHYFAACVCGRVDISYAGLGTTCPADRRGHGWDVDRVDRAYGAAFAFRPDGRGR